MIGEPSERRKDFMMPPGTFIHRLLPHLSVRVQEAVFCLLVQEHESNANVQLLRSKPRRGFRAPANVESLTWRIFRR
jgi:hypothetical protein